MPEKMLNRFRSQARDYIETLRYQTALYWAEKAVTVSNGQVEDVYLLAKCMHFCTQYHRAANLITSLKLDQKHLSCKHLAALSLYEAKMYSEALGLLEVDFEWKDLPAKSCVDSASPFPSSENLRSSLYLLRGKIHEAMDNRIPAIEDYKTSLKLDVCCNEAFELLVRHEMLTPDEESSLLESLPFEEQCDHYEGESVLIQALYNDQIKKYCKPQERKPCTELAQLQNNLSVRVNYAQRLMNGCDYKECLSTLQKIMKEDPYHQGCLPIYITCLVAMKKSQALFRLSHELVDCDPDNATAWYAVGCYYYVIERFEEARKYLHKTTSLDHNHGAAWLMRGHAFAAENEHDQAMAAYFKASQLMRGSHLPMLYVGLEHGLTNNVRLANSFFSQAHSLAPDDPFVLHELGTVAYQNGDYPLADKCFAQAVDMIRINSAGDTRPIDETWEPLLNNLGHVCRKLKKYSTAIEFHQKALLVCPGRSSTYASLGYVHALTGNACDAVEYFQKALALKRDDTFSTNMLNSVLDLYLNEAPPFPGAPSDIPPPQTLLPATPPPCTPSSGSVGGSGSAHHHHHHHLMASAGDRSEATSNMEMSNISMADISEEDVLAMDTPTSFYGSSRPDDSILSGIGPLRTPSESLVTPSPVVSSYGFGSRPGELGFRNNRRGGAGGGGGGGGGGGRESNPAHDGDTPIMQRR